MKRIAVVCSIVLMVFIVAVLGFSWWSARNAEAFSQALGRIDPRTAGNRDAEILAQRYQAYVDHSISSCSPASCVYEFHFTNRILSKLKLAPFSRVYASLQLVEGRFKQAGFVFYDSANALSVSVVEFPSSPELPAFQSDIISQNGSVRFISAKLTGDASPQKKAAAFNLNTSCLARIGGCKSLEQMAPELWRVSERR